MATVKGGTIFSQSLKLLADKLAKPGTLRVGFLENATYPNGTPVAMVAAIQNYGAPKVGIPPRPFMTNTVTKHSKEWPEEAGKVLKASNMDVDKTLGLMGERIKGQIQDEITALMAPPLSPVTLMLRKMKMNNPDLKINRTVVNEARARVKAGESYAGVSTKPLIDTGHLLNSVDYEVK